MKIISVLIGIVGIALILTGCSDNGLNQCLKQEKELYADIQSLQHAYWNCRFPPKNYPSNIPPPAYDGN